MNDVWIRSVKNGILGAFTPPAAYKSQLSPWRIKTMQILSQNGLNRYKEYLINTMNSRKTEDNQRKFGVGQKLKMTPQQQQQLSSSIYRLSLTQMFSDTVCLVF